ncbi:acyltransferase [Deinococcus sp.]|uniref:acyltransferase family protein n=1 Tax=Deinococcus sp. TaxID=47478 RepID=UPI0025C4DF34|nr:acyltransferase [Deinococcus sp.]
MITLISILPLYILGWFCAKFCLGDRLLREKSELPAKYWQIDGLRFFLAFSVFLSHTFIIREYVVTGRWALTDDKVATFLGQGGVSLFFIITAFLFWDKAMRQPLKFDAVEFFIGRIRRLAPAYLIVAVPFIILSLIQIPFFSPSIIKEVFQTLGLGYFRSVNIGVAHLSPAYTGVFWTLFYEWKFYFFLPVLYILLRFKNALTLTASLASLVLLTSSILDIGLSKDWPFISLFASGILSATIYNSKYFEELRCSQYLVGAIFIGSILFHIFSFSGESYYGASHPTLFFITFLALLKIEKTSIIGRVFLGAPTILLGSASYSLYVAHGFIISALSILFYSLFGVFSNTVFYIFSIGSTCLVSLLSIALYRYIELPYAFRKPLPQGVPST